MPLGMDVGIGPGYIVLDGTQLRPQEEAQQPPTFWPMSIVAKLLPISATAELLLDYGVYDMHMPGYTSRIYCEILVGAVVTSLSCKIVVQSDSKPDFGRCESKRCHSSLACNFAKC